MANVNVDSIILYSILGFLVLENAFEIYLGIRQVSLTFKELLGIE